MVFHDCVEDEKKQARNSSRIFSLVLEMHAYHSLLEAHPEPSDIHLCTLMVPPGTLCPFI